MIAPWLLLNNPADELTEDMPFRAPAGVPIQEMVKRVQSVPQSNSPKSERTSAEESARTATNRRVDEFADLDKLIPYFAGNQKSDVPEKRLGLVGLPQLAAQRGAIERLAQASENQLKIPARRNIAPTLSFLDSISKGNSLKAYQQPDDANTELNRVINTLALKTKAENEYSDNVTNMFNAARVGQLRDMLERGTNIYVGTPNFGGFGNQMPVHARAIRDIQEKFSSKIAPFEQSIKGSDEVIGLMKSVGKDKALAKKFAQTFLARARGEVGNLSYYEQVGTVEAGDIVSKMNQLAEDIISGGLTDTNKAAVMDLSKRLKSAALRSIKTTRQKYQEMGSAAYGPYLGLGANDFQLSGADTVIEKNTIKALKAWAAKPENANHPKLPAVRAAIARKEAEK